MLSLDRTKELLALLNLSEEEMEDVRVLSWLLAGVAFDASQDCQKKENDHESRRN